MSELMDEVRSNGAFVCLLRIETGRDDDKTISV